MRWSPLDDTCGLIIVCSDSVKVWHPTVLTVHEVCPGSIQPFWISREPVAWPWCNLAASQSEETLLCIREQSLSHGSSLSAVRRRWLSLCTVWPSHSQWPSEQISFITTMRSRAGFFAKHHISRVCQPPLQPRFGSLRLLALPKAKIAVEMEDICECDGRLRLKCDGTCAETRFLSFCETDKSI